MNDFERQKNLKAGTITGIICALLIFLALIISWAPPVPQQIPEEEGIEVNLGNSETGMGDVQPLIPDPPAADKQEVNTPPKTQLTAAEPLKEVETNDDDKEAPEAVIPKPVKPEPKATKVPEKENAAPVKPTTTKPQVVDNPKPVVQKPKNVMKADDGTGKGGNDADSWNNSKNQGIAGGKGDQGKPSGNPDSDSYTGNGGSGKSGVSISRGLAGRSFRSLPSFEDEFNENAKVAVDIRVDKAGNVLSATYQPRGSTTSDAGMREIALRKARGLKLNATTSGSDEQLGTIIFNFRLKN